MDKKYVNESEKVKEAYKIGTEVGHCRYISYLETELTKAMSATCEANGYAMLYAVMSAITGGYYEINKSSKKYI